MFEASEFLESYVRGIRRLSGAASVSLYVPAPLSRLAPAVLIHDGEEPPLPELADLEAAAAFSERARDHLATSGGGADADAEAPAFVSSSAPGGELTPLPQVRTFWSGGLLPAALYKTEHEDAGRRRTDARPAESEDLPAAWLGLRLPAGAGGAGSVSNRLSDRDLGAHLGSGQTADQWWRWLFSLGGALASHTSHVSAILKDPVTGLPDRVGFQAVLSEELEKARLNSRHLSLLLINPDEFAPINERFGREAGDSIIRDISVRLRGVLRSSDPVSRYGGVIFAAVLTDTDKGLAQRVSEKILAGIGEGAFLNGAVRLGFSIGFVVFDPEGTGISDPQILIRRADQALNSAKRLGGGCIVDWDQRSGIEETGAFDRLSGIFTGNMAKDYRNMVLLWDAVDVISARHDFDGLAAHAVERIYASFKPQRVALFSRDEDGELSLVRGLTRRPPDAAFQERIETVELDPQEMELLRLSIAAGEPREETRHDEDDEDEENEEGDDTNGGARTCYAMPLTASGEVLGALYLDGSSETLALEASDLIFLKALGGQLTVALDRARLSELERSRQEQERRRLRAELKELRQALQQAKLVYRSAELEAVVATARRVAPTDATVLITGESGTGKELLARTVHELSTRRARPFVIVDCGSIPTTLIESELFGHEKGAYTGAQQRRMGRLSEADGGTVLLDEVGELPLEVQSKLLRFVQEKQFTTVGGTRTKSVDVRILAATNRELGAEVAAGRFREDLYYRLNVVRLEVPPLRERPDDVMHLARHFLENFSIQYQKNVRRFAPDAEAAMMTYPWPGNVRELQNRLMQAVILCEGEELRAAELRLPATADGIASAGRGGETAISIPGAAVASAAPGTAGTGRDGSVGAGGSVGGTGGIGGTGDIEDFAGFGAGAPVPTPSAGDCWDRLRGALRQEIDLTLSADAEVLFPLGRWIRDDLVLEADEAAGGVARQGAVLLGIPETTFRRRVRKARQQARAGMAPRSGRWQETRSILRETLTAGEPPGTDLVEIALRVLLEEVLERAPNDTRTGSGLLGVTAPTFRSRLAALRDKSETA